MATQIGASVGETIEHLALGLSTAAALYFGLRRNKREELVTDLEVDEHIKSDREEALRVKDELIESLTTDRNEIREQLKRSLAREERLRDEIAEERKAARAREASLQGQIDELRRELSTVQDENRKAVQQILEAVITGDRCLKAARCDDREIPGDRRSTGDDVKAGGTD